MSDKLRQMIDELPSAMDDAWGDDDGEAVAEVLSPILSAIAERLEALEARRKPLGCDGAANPAAEEGWDTGRRTAKITSGGDIVFEGDVHMFRNCFFDNAEWGNVLRWAETEGFAVELLDAEEGQR